MKGKRRIGAALLLIFCLVAAAALAIDGNATNGTPFVTHEHNWIRPTVVREATCSSTGIRRYYCDETSPLSDVLESDRAFFDLFVDFKGYVDYFFFQDCVNEDYSAVKIWHGKGDFSENPLPETVEDYLAWIEKEMIFLDQRNKRIVDYVRS